MVIRTLFIKRDVVENKKKYAFIYLMHVYVCTAHVKNGHWIENEKQVFVDFFLFFNFSLLFCFIYFDFPYDFDWWWGAE